ncbi:MAG: hypothetical protein U1E88_04775 [Acinetobacter sp.]
MSDNYAHTSTATALGSAKGTAHISTNSDATLTSVAGITVTSTSLNMDDIDSFTVGGGNDHQSSGSKQSNSLYQCSQKRRKYGSWFL